MIRSAVTLRHVAAEAGVSVATASRVLNRGKFAERISEPCADRVRAVALRLGYRTNYLARSIKLGRSDAIGLALELGEPGAARTPAVLIGNSYYQSLIAGIEAGTYETTYGLSLIGPGNGVTALERGLRAIEERRLDALIVVGFGLKPAQQQLLQGRERVPVVVIQPDATTKLPSVDFDDQAGVRLAVQHLAELGHRELLWVGPATSEDMAHAVQREQYFMTTVWDLGLRGASCRFEAHRQPAGNRLHELAEAALGPQLRKPHRATAVVCYNDLVAIGVLRALAHRGYRVPQRMSVVGFDNIEADVAVPPLTSVDHRLFELGRRACALALESANAPVAPDGPAPREVLAPRLAIRDSTGPATSTRAGRRPQGR